MRQTADANVWKVMQSKKKGNNFDQKQIKMEICMCEGGDFCKTWPIILNMYINL